jgi:hypothetical protein
LSLHASIESVYDFEPPQLLVLTFFDADPDLDPAFNIDPDLDPASEKWSGSEYGSATLVLVFGTKRKTEKKGSGVTELVTK